MPLIRRSEFNRREAERKKREEELDIAVGFAIARQEREDKEAREKAQERASKKAVLQAMKNARLQKEARRRHSRMVREQASASSEGSLPVTETQVKSDSSRTLSPGVAAEPIEVSSTSSDQCKEMSNVIGAKRQRKEDDDDESPRPKKLKIFRDTHARTQEGQDNAPRPSANLNALKVSRVVKGLPKDLTDQQVAKQWPLDGAAPPLKHYRQWIRLRDAAEAEKKKQQKEESGRVTERRILLKPRSSVGKEPVTKEGASQASRKRKAGTDLGELRSRKSIELDDTSQTSRELKAGHVDQPYAKKPVKLNNASKTLRERRSGGKAGQPPFEKSAKLASTSQISQKREGQFDLDQLQFKKLGSPDGVSQISRKRKVDDDVEPARPKRRMTVTEQGSEQNGSEKKADLKPAALANPANGCFMNSIVQALHSMPEVVVRLPRADSARLADLSSAECGASKSSRKSRAGKLKHEKVKVAVEKMKERQEITINPCLANLLEQVGQGEKQGIDPSILYALSGLMFQNEVGEPMNGDNPEDASAFFRLVLAAMSDEQPESGFENLFRLALVGRMTCENCKTAKDLADADLTLLFPVDKQKRNEMVPLAALFQLALEDTSKFEEFCCTTCGIKGSWERPEGWSRKRVSVAPTYLQIPVNRLSGNGYRKVTTEIGDLTDAVEITMTDGSAAKYELIASIHHIGASVNKGHYYTVRKLGDQWYKCDDANRGGITPCSIRNISHLKEAGMTASLLIFKKI